MSTEMREYVFEMNPFSAPRMSRRDRFNPSPAVRRYYGNRDQFKLEANRQGLTELPAALGFVFLIPVSQSWSNAKKHRHIGNIHQQKPDLDNMIKAVLDSITYGKHRDDAHLSTIVFAQKLWAAEGDGRIMLYVPDQEEANSSIIGWIKQRL